MPSFPKEYTKEEEGENQSDFDFFGVFFASHFWMECSLILHLHNSIAIYIRFWINFANAKLSICAIEGNFIHTDTQHAHTQTVECGVRSLEFDMSSYACRIATHFLLYLFYIETSQ